jgi:thiol-disulfide isomerase/thioredoxin
LLVNFWATWCPPCIEELPLINAFYRENNANGWQVLALAIDRLAPVQSFLAQHPLDFPVAMAGMSGTELVRSLGNLSGGLPFSVAVGGDGSVLQRKLGRLSSDDLAVWRSLK